MISDWVIVSLMLLLPKLALLLRWPDQILDRHDQHQDQCALMEVKKPRYKPGLYFVQVPARDCR